MVGDDEGLFQTRILFWRTSQDDVNVTLTTLCHLDLELRSLGNARLADFYTRSVHEPSIVVALVRRAGVAKGIGLPTEAFEVWFEPRIGQVDVGLAALAV